MRGLWDWIYWIWNYGILELWNTGILEYWNIGIFVSPTSGLPTRQLSDFNAFRSESNNPGISSLLQVPTDNLYHGKSDDVPNAENGTSPSLASSSMN